MSTQPSTIVNSGYVVQEKLVRIPGMGVYQIGEPNASIVFTESDRITGLKAKSEDKMDFVYETQRGMFFRQSYGLPRALTKLHENSDFDFNPNAGQSPAPATSPAPGEGEQGPCLTISVGGVDVPLSSEQAKSLCELACAVARDNPSANPALYDLVNSIVPSDPNPDATLMSKAPEQM